MNQLKIGFVLDDGLDSTDGVQQYVLTLGSWLRAQGHEVHYLAGQTKRTDLRHLHSLSRNMHVRFNKNRMSIPLPVSARRLHRLLHREQFDVLHVQMPYSPQLAGRIIAHAPASTAVVGTFHILPYGRMERVGTRLLVRLTASTLRSFDVITSVSTAAQQFADQVLKTKTVLIPNAVDLRVFAKGKKTMGSQPSIVFLGRLVARKGALQLLQAIRRMHDRGELVGTRVIIAGNGSERRRLEKYVQLHALKEYVEFRGRISEAQKANLLADATIAVLPSLSGESFGIVVVEAIAAGAGVTVGGDNPGYQFVLSNTPETLVDPRDTIQFAALLTELLHNGGLRGKLQRRQQQRIQAFDTNVVGPQIAAVYGRAIAKRAQKADNITHD